MMLALQERLTRVEAQLVIQSELLDGNPFNDPTLTATATSSTFPLVSTTNNDTIDLPPDIIAQLKVPPTNNAITPSTTLTNHSTLSNHATTTNRNNQQVLSSPSPTSIHVNGKSNTSHLLANKNPSNKRKK
jgi:hypothetical protein